MAARFILCLGALVASASAFGVTGVKQPAMPSAAARSRSATMAQADRTAAGVAATSLALLLSAANPVMTHAAVEPPAVVQQYGSAMVADADADLRDAQKKFLEERASMRTKYDIDDESTFKSAVETGDKKNIYVTIVGGLIFVAFLAPMLQFFYYTGGD